MPPRSQQAPPTGQTAGSAAVATSAAPTAATAVGAALGPALLLALGGALGASAVSGLASRITEAIEEATEKRARDFWRWAESTLEDEFADRPGVDLREALAREEGYEAEFRRKMRDRLETDLPSALLIPEPGARIERVAAIFDREKRFTAMREEAMMTRAVGEIEAQILEHSSPDGAYWKLDPTVKEHTLDCIAMGEKFWPWPVLKEWHPPRHAGCPCRLLSLTEALDMGLMAESQIPDKSDALTRFRSIRRRFEGVEEAVVELVDDDGIEPASLLEARRGIRTLLRWDKGLEKGGEFKPTRGGSSARTGVRVKRPKSLRDRKASRWTYVRGEYVEIPEGQDWKREQEGHVFTSPAGSTNVYRDGSLISAPDMPSPPEERQRRAVTLSTPDLTRDERRELARRLRRGQAQSLIREDLKAGRTPVQEGDRASHLLALRDEGFALRRSVGTVGRTTMDFERGSHRVTTRVRDNVVEWVSDERTPVPREGASLDRPPRSWNEHAADALAWADEFGMRFGKEVHLPEVRVGDGLADHAGTHHWTGEVDLGVDVRRDIEAAAAARRAGRKLTDGELAGVWASMWATAHEGIGHAVNPIDPNHYKGAHKHLEEALAEEAAHLAAVERLIKQGQFEVLAWRQRNPDHPSVAGVYPQARAALRSLLEEAGFESEEAKRAAIVHLKFKVPPVERLNVLSDALVAAGRGVDDAPGHVRLTMESPDPEQTETVLGPPQSPGWYDGKGDLFSSLYDHFAKGGKEEDAPKAAEPEEKRPPKPPKPKVIGGKGEAPKEQGVIPSYDHETLELGKGAGGSNGAQWAFDADGHRWLVKRYNGNQDRIATELLANRVYNAMGAKVAPAGTIEIDGKPALTYPTLEGEVRERIFRDGEPSEEVGRHYMTDALLGNWDFVGMDDDNIMWDPQGKPFRVDQGGTFEFRAMGNSKPFGPVPTEVWTMIQKGQGKRASKVSEFGMREQAKEIAATLTPTKVDELVDAAPFKDEAMRERIRENLKARIGWYDAFARGEVDLPRPAEGAEAREALSKPLEGFDPYPEQEAALFDYSEGLSEPITEHLRSGGKTDDLPGEQRRTVRELDALIRAVPTTKEDVWAFVGINIAGVDAGGLVGKTLEEKSFLHLTTDEDEARTSPTVMRVMIPAGSYALHTPGLRYDDLPEQPEIIAARRSRVKIVRTYEKDGVTYVEATLVTEKPYKPYKGKL